MRMILIVMVEKAIRIHYEQVVCGIESVGSIQVIEVLNNSIIATNMMHQSIKDLPYH